MPKLTGHGDQQRDGRGDAACRRSAITAPNCIVTRAPRVGRRETPSPNFANAGPGRDDQRDDDREQRWPARAARRTASPARTARPATVAAGRALRRRTGHGGRLRLHPAIAASLGMAGVLALGGAIQSLEMRRPPRAGGAAGDARHAPRGVRGGGPRQFRSALPLPSLICAFHASAIILTTLLGQRHVVQLGGHLLAVLERPVEELQRLDGCSRACRPWRASG